MAEWDEIPDKANLTLAEWTNGDYEKQKKKRELMSAEDTDAVEDEPEPCKCHDGMDIRGRCDPVLNAAKFANCPAKVDTAYWFLLNNDADTYNKFCLTTTMRREKRNEKAKEIARAAPYNLVCDELNELEELFENDDRNDGDFDCVCCNEYVPLDYEDDANWEDGWLVCRDCCETHYCQDCEYFDKDDEIEKDEAGNRFCEECVEKRNSELADKLKEELDEMIYTMERDEELDCLRKLVALVKKEYKKE
jgi:hypothetical protein